MAHKTKLIEVVLPLKAINLSSAREEFFIFRQLNAKRGPALVEQARRLHNDIISLLPIEVPL